MSIGAKEIIEYEEIWFKYVSKIDKKENSGLISFEKFDRLYDKLLEWKQRADEIRF